ncbi:cell division protein FtsA [Candidatus Magnetominusculus dajiuhuensis]|uniref:cell division protein FtsA n=1 Tax=Candidatus Magnetominusculus dajiuhuensis TaxID=3137712 RepID=UPI003B42CB80
MGEGSYITGLDIGTSKVTAIVARVTETTTEVAGVGMAVSAGVRKGVVVDLEGASAAIREAVNKAQVVSGVEIKEVCTGLSDMHMKSFKSTGAVVLTTDVVTQRDIDKVMETAGTVYVPLDKEIMHMIPVEYVVDGEGQIYNPVGMSGVRLEANVQVVVGASNSIHNVVKCCEMAGLKVADVVFNPLASAAAVLREDEKAYGAILIDIGGGTTDIALFKNGAFMGAAVIDIGGNQFTNDIAVGLRLPVYEAERLKKAYGMATFPDEYFGEEITVTANMEERRISKSFITEIIKARSEELTGMIKEAILGVPGFSWQPWSVVLTGGVAQLKGLEGLISSVLDLPVRVGTCEWQGIGDKIRGPMNATAVGFLSYTRKRLYDSGSVDAFTTGQYSMSKWFKGLVGKFFNR